MDIIGGIEGYGVENDYKETFCQEPAFGSALYPCGILHLLAFGK